ncbi:protein Spindly-like [Oscarella lobularis]|uniref:protein Spindly-like n=1 Tax=Oscarella lobularis TaxID=121494 RepID=UPI0033138956
MEGDEALDELRRQLDEKQAEVAMAATAGLQVLEQNKELEEKLASVQNEFAIEIDRLEQENYDLKRQLSIKERLLDEKANATPARKRADAEAARRAEREWEERVRALRLERDDIRSDADRERLVNGQLRERIVKCESIIDELKAEVAQMSRIDGLENEVWAMRESLQRAREAKRAAEAEANAAVRRVDDLVGKLEQAKRRMSSLEEERIEIEQQAIAWREELDNAKGERVELMGELQVLKANQMAAGKQTSGNSLFSEVEDRRLQTEKELISYKVKYEVAEKAYSVAREHLKKMKSQLGALLQSSVGSSEADRTRIRRLQKLLGQRHNDVLVLRAKVKNLEEKTSRDYLGRKLKDYHDAFSSFKDKRLYVEHLQNEMERMKADLKQAFSEIHEKDMTTASHLAQIRDFEEKLALNESRVQEQKNQLANLSMKFDEQFSEQNHHIQLLETELTQLRLQTAAEKTSEVMRWIPSSQQSLHCLSV